LDRLSVADIITAVDEPLDATQCGGKENCRDEGRCMTHELWSTLNDKMYEYLSSVTLSDLVARQRAREAQKVKVLQDKRPGGGTPMGSDAGGRSVPVGAV
jgi:Rrf2 family iron-sulfur cluster assembly transcriptional regulator